MQRDVCDEGVAGTGHAMSMVHATLDAPISAVWATLIDAETYPRWLIGARRIRRVDPGWPEPGTAFHHEVGLGGPLTVRDCTKSLVVDPERCLQLDVRARPFVRAKVTFTLRSVPEGTEVGIEEHPIGWHRALAPVMAPLVAARNKASLEKLESAARSSAPPPGP